jgi:mRNA interferase RelE/StbE
MPYTIEYNYEATRDMRKLSPEVARRIVTKIDRLSLGLSADVKRLTHFTPKYRLRVGDWRVLFDLEKDRLIVCRVCHRSEAYQ